MAISGPSGFIGRGLPPTGLAALLARPGLRDALIGTGSALLAQRDQPGSLGGALGRALPVGMQAFQQGQQKAEYEQMLASAPPEMRQLLTMLGPERGIPALLGMMTPKPKADPKVVGKSLVDPTTGEVIFAEPDAPDKPPELPPVLRGIYHGMGIDDPNTATPEQRAQALATFERLEGPAPGTTVNVNAVEGAAGRAIGESVARTIGGDQAAQAAVQTVGTIDRIAQVVSNPKFREVSGPLFGGRFGELRAQFADDPAARELLAEFNTLGGQMTMAQLEAFTGPKTDFEFRQAKRLVLNEPNMTAEEIQAGLRRLREVAVQDAQRWAKRLLALDPERLNFDPQDIAPQLELANQIISTYGENASGAGSSIYQKYPNLRPR